MVKTITRVDLYQAVYQTVGMSRAQSAAIVEQVLAEITECLARGETVKLATFGSFIVREKRQRIGRNPKTREKVPIEARRVLTFKPSPHLKNRINGRNRLPQRT